jgi:hypothetical protein
MDFDAEEFLKGLEAVEGVVATGALSLPLERDHLSDIHMDRLPGPSF